MEKRKGWKIFTCITAFLFTAASTVLGYYLVLSTVDSLVKRFGMLIIFMMALVWVSHLISLLMKKDKK